MKAAEYYRYGDPEVMKVIEVERPTPKPGELLLQVHATTVTATETAFRKGDPFITRFFTGMRKPKLKRLGEELAGTVVARGSDVTKFKVGDEVFGTAGPKFGANAAFVVVEENGVLAQKPTNCSFQEAAASVDGFLTALPFLRDKGKIKKGQKVLIYGASGSVGSAAVQIAHYLQTEVTAVCSAKNHALMKTLGADFVIDYTKEDFTQNHQQYDIIFDTVHKISFSKSKKSLKPTGIFLEAGMGFGVLKHVLCSSLFGRKKAKIAATGLRPVPARRKDLELLDQLMTEGHIQPVIDKVYPFNEIVQAHTYVDRGHKVGNVVLGF